ncbi:MAG: elongation factor Tu [Methanosarcinaceae archaeon]|nr:elongation factor Tu [Methanosarcinaceae archaeon]
MTKIAIIGSERSGRTTLASKLGKKGEGADITMYDFAKSGRILTTIDANGYPKAIKPLITALNLSDIAILCIPPTGLDASAGECIVALDLLGYKHGIIVFTKLDTSYPQAIDELMEKIKKITSGTALENWEYMSISTTSFEGMEELKEMIFSIGDTVDKELAQLNELPKRVVIDQFFNVTGIGCVVLGVVSQGTINAKDKTGIFPLNKNIEIRSIQLHDVDAKSAPTGSRVGLALKNIQSKELERGFVISDQEEVAEGLTLECTLSQFSKGFTVGDMLHVFTGLQSAPMRIENISIGGSSVNTAAPASTCIVSLSGTKEVAYSKTDRFVLTNLDEKQRFVGYGFCQ